jgi:hypothetical protein
VHALPRHDFIDGLGAVIREHVRQLEMATVTTVFELSTSRGIGS